MFSVFLFIAQIIVCAVNLLTGAIESSNFTRLVEKYQ